jgi:phospholipid transport system substrate-binding protein
MKRPAVLLAMVFMLGAPPAMAAAPTPESVVQKVSVEMLAAARHGMTEAAVRRLSTYFDFARMSALAVGPALERALPSQQVQLTGEFRQVALRTYAGLLASTREAALEFGPARKPGPGETEVTVHAQLRHADGTVRIDYLIGLTDEGWKIYDLRVDGASFASTWRSEFGAQIRERGIDGLIEALAARNRRAAAAAL